jgi:uncharacterized protein (UPF0264 family)
MQKKYLLFFYAATVRSTWGLKECKSRKYFYDLFQCMYREIKHANLNMQICSAEYKDKYRVTSRREFRVLTPMV